MPSKRLSGIIFVSLLTLCSLLSSCNKEKGYYIEGSVDSTLLLDGKIIFLQLDPETKLDSTIVRNGSFSFKGPKVDTPKLAFVSTYELDLPALDFVLENGTIRMRIGKNTAHGTPLNEANTKYNLSKLQINEDFVNFMNQIHSDSGKYSQIEIEKKLIEAFDNMQSHETDLAIDLFSEHFNDALGVKSILSLMHNRPDDASRAFELKEMAGPIVRENEQVIKALRLYENLMSSQVGNMYKEVEGIDTNTEMPIKLSDFVGKGTYTLVDFWASWCGPCRGEFPFLTRAMELYSKEGLQIVGISVWDEWDDHEMARNSLKIPWPQIFDDSQESIAAIQYGISGIPQIILFDPEGRIVARNLRGEEIFKKLEKIYPKTKKKARKTSRK